MRSNMNLTWVTLHSIKTSRKLFDKVMNKVEDVIIHERLQRSNIFTEEGIINRHECWAESIELFFENPAELNGYYPDLYNLIKSLLNQDTLQSIGSHRRSSIM